MENKISYCTLIYDGCDIETAVRDIASAGYDGIELYPKDWEWGIEHLGRETFSHLFKDAGLAVSAVFGDVLSASEQNITSAISAAKLVGATYIFAVPPVKNSVDRSRCLRIINHVCSLLEDHGLNLVLHNHAGTCMESISESVDICSSIDRKNFGLCLDSVHFALYDDDIHLHLEPLLPFIRYVHLKDMTKPRRVQYETLPPDMWRWGDLAHLASTYTDLEHGVIDNRAIAEYLIRSGYSGWWVPEIERQQADRLEHASFNHTVLKSYL